MTDTLNAAPRQQTATSPNNPESTTIEGGSYDVLKARLENQGANLRELAQTFNEKRQQTFGGSDFSLTGKANVQTESRCIPVDMAQVNGQLLFGYQVYVGLKSTPSLDDVFGLYSLHENDGTYRVEPLSLEDSFLSEPQFRHEFVELFTYYKDARLSQISRQENTLYLAFRIGMRPEDRKVFRFEITPDKVRYIDAQGHLTLDAAKQHDFEWTLAGRDGQVEGDHPHISIADKLFIECINGDLTIKIENNTAEGQGIYREPVEDTHQSLSDAETAYAFVGDLILLKVLPNREKHTRYFIYNPLTQTVTRADALGLSGKCLPEDHGVLYSNGYVLTGGESKQFDKPWQGLEFFQKIASPNGEDLLYFFFNITLGHYVIYSYNLIEKTFAAPIDSHGYSIYPDGRMLMFHVSENAEAATIHPLRIWNTPFSTQEFYVNSTSDEQARGGKDPFVTNLGNAELVRALSSILSISQLAKTDDVNQTAFETLLKQCQTTLDHYGWLTNASAIGLGQAVTEMVSTVDAIIDEFAKVRQLQQHAEQTLEKSLNNIEALTGRLKLAPKDDSAVLLGLLADVKKTVGETMVLRQMRYMPETPVTGMLDTLAGHRQQLNQSLLSLLQEPAAYEQYKQQIAALEDKLLSTDKTADLSRLQEQAEEIRADLSLVTEEVAEIETDDPTQATRILDLTTEVSSKLNAASARLRQKHQALQETEAQAEFSAQFNLLAQAVSSAMEQAQSPEQCDEQLAKLVVFLDKLESRFADFDQFLAEIYKKRDEIQSTLDNHKQQLVAARQRRVENLNQAANVTFSSIAKRVSRFEDSAALNSFFATDNMVQKLHQLSKNIRDFGDSVKADAIDSKLKAVQDQSLRSLRDNQDIFEQGGKVLRFGKHKFSVNLQPLELTLVDQRDDLALHVSGTDFYEALTDEKFLARQQYAKLDVVSESPSLYRSEYLAFSILDAAINNQDNLSIALLNGALKENTLSGLTQKFSAPRYREGYIKGVHDHDANKILSAVLPCYMQAGLLRFGQQERAHALLSLAAFSEDALAQLKSQATNAMALMEHLSSNTAFVTLKNQLSETLTSTLDSNNHADSADYLLRILAKPGLKVEVSRDGQELCDGYLSFRRSIGWQAEGDDLFANYSDHLQWLTAFCQHKSEGGEFVCEAAMLATLADNSRIAFQAVDFSMHIEVDGLLGEHVRLERGKLDLVLDDFLKRSRSHQNETVPEFESYLTQRSEMLDGAKQQLRLSEFTPRPLTSFVRNKLISEKYLPLIGDNFAKQMGTVGKNKRSDLMGMLLLISPPGYGKTTLIEYVAHKLGLVFMKINGPSLGHTVTSLDPADAPDQNAAREIEKINLAFEMGNNVLLYLDDIQHTNPEFLQKFISLCDGTRRVEGTWKGKTKTYDMRGKKFAVVMAGNPYTESGDVFKIPDMLSNRADIYNLGDMLSDQKSAFELSFIENSLTSNSVLAPLATRDLGDLYKLIDIARGESIPLSDLVHPYSATEANEITSTLEKMLTVQKTVLSVNQQYIASAATDDSYRTEPPFKLQGSYRNMNKLAEKISSVMTDEELNLLVQDHYQGEAQTLTTGTEENLLKLAQIRGDMTAEQQHRWQEIKDSYQRKLQTGDSDDRAGQVVQQLVALNQNLAKVSEAFIDDSRDVSQ